jgi:FkbM family methyltransferase
VGRTELILDVGGGGGAISTWFSRWAERVIVFEPSPHNRERIRIHHRIRGVRNVELVPCAIGDAQGEATLHLKREPGHNSLGDIGASETVDHVRVPVRTLDAFALERGIERVGLLKIDVEGFEPEVIRGADRLLRERRVDLVVFEFSPAFYRQRGIEPTAVVDALEDRGYRVLELDGRAIDRPRLERGRQTDLIAEPNPPKNDPA